MLLLAHELLRRAYEGVGRKPIAISPAAADRLLAHAWPGNVRELQGCMERAALLAAGDQLLVEDLPPSVRSRQQILVAATEPGDVLPLREVEQRYVRGAIETVRGNKTEAARLLGLDRRTLYRKLRRRRAIA